MNSSLNPLLYCWKIHEIRQVVLVVIARLFFAVTVKDNSSQFSSLFADGKNRIAFAISRL